MLRSLLLLLASPFMFSTATTVTVIGDSLFAGGSTIVQTLEEKTGTPIVNKAIVGAGLHEGWVKSIVQQYMELEDKPTTLIMDGGGNDVMSKRNDCMLFDDECRQTIDEVTHLVEGIFEKAKNDGIKHIIYLGFYYINSLHDAVDYGSENIYDICSTAPVPCYFVDPRNTSIPTGWDGLHPSTEGYQMLADLIWQVKVDHTIPL